MKIDNLEQLDEKIDGELAWRKKELTSIKIDVDLSKNKEDIEKTRIIKAGIIFLYAHWEGAIKCIVNYYLVYVFSLDLRYRELKNNFLAISIKQSLDKFKETNKPSIYNKIIDEIYLKQEEKLNGLSSYNNIIKTNSNLKMDIFKEIMAMIGLDSKKYELKSKYIDQKLLGNRNKIAHGERIQQLDGIFDICDYINLHDTVLNLIDSFAEDIKDAAKNEKYKI